MRVAVTGATGRLGRQVVPHLVDAGADVVEMPRRNAHYDDPQALRQQRRARLTPA
jgi:uncharacterized protein YbjT (DUF2867 family)